MTTENDSGWTDATDAALANANDEWRDVEAEAQIILEVEGDGFVGRFMGMDPPNANGIIQAHFTNVTDLHGEAIGGSCFLNTTRDLQNKLKKVPVKAMTRCLWESSLDTGHESGTPMRVFRVQWK